MKDYKFAVNLSHRSTHQLLHPSSPPSLPLCGSICFQDGSILNPMDHPGGTAAGATPSVVAQEECIVSV